VRILLDECLPRRLKRELPGHDVRTTPEMGWAGKRNGELLRLAEREFEVFLTVDRKLQRQQNLSAFNIAVIVMIFGAEQHAGGFATADGRGSE
jgi:predicted nuclease of predicted toxin-antitoxin system